MMVRAVIDTNVLVSGLKSNLGASFRLLNLVISGDVRPAVTTPLVIEYDAVLHRPSLLPASLSPTDINDFLDWFVSRATRHKVYYLWRPFLSDPNDDLVVEAAMSSASRCIVTFNVKDFRGVADLGIIVLTPSQFLKHIEQ